MSWYLAVLKNYVGFSGRARRTEYWMFTLVNLIVALILFVLVLATKSTALVALYWLYGLAVLLPSLAVASRRLHDSGKSFAWILIGLVPFVGAVVLLVFMCLPGTPGPNQYGADPKAMQYA
jgi:uncharacterized membrane protein YhaH (DUF805 family)